MHCIRAENASINALSTIEAEVIAIEQDNQRVKAAMGSSLQELKTGQALLSKDLGAKVGKHSNSRHAKKAKKKLRRVCARACFRRETGERIRAS